MTQEEYNLLKQTLSGFEKENHIHLRLGQRFFNYLGKVYPKIADEIRGTQIDPFYVDDRLPNCLNYIREFHVKNNYESSGISC
jgi:hypothetical protein